MSKKWNKKDKEEDDRQEFETTITYIYKQTTSIDDLEREIENKEQEIERLQAEIDILKDDLKEIKKL